MKKMFLFSALGLSLCMAGCQEVPNNTTLPEKKSTEHELTVVTSFYPLAFFTQEIVGDTANVIDLVGGDEPHSYILSPRDRVTMSNADLVIYQGAGLESWTEDLIPELEKKGVATLKASEGIHLIKFADGDIGEEEEEHHQHGAINPHTWLSPVLAEKTAENIAHKLMAIHPEKKDLYLKNLKTLQNKLQNIDNEYKITLSHCKKPEALISHNAFGYLESRYHFTLHPIAGFSPSDEPSAKLLSELKKIVEKDGIHHILSEENNVQKYTDMIVAETGIQSHQINTMESESTETYFQIAQENLKTLSVSLECQ